MTATPEELQSAKQELISTRQKLTSAEDQISELQREIGSATEEGDTPLSSPLDYVKLAVIAVIVGVAGYLFGRRR